MSAGEAMEQQVRRLVGELGSWRRGRRQAARRELAALGADAVEPLLDIAAEQQTAYLRLESATKWLTLIWFPYQILRAMHNFMHLRGVLWTVIDAVFTAIIFCSAVPLAAAAVRGRRLRLSLRSLADVDDRRIVGPFTDALASDSKTLKKIARASLKRALPRLASGDSHLITAERQRLLCAELGIASETYGDHFDMELSLAILHALEQVGDAEALPAIRRLADANASYESKRRLCVVARRVLPVLQERAERAAAGRLLLRAADGPPGTSVTLLRPASSVDDTPQEQLLRPSAPEPGADG